MTVLSRQPFGVTRAGEPAERITLDNGILSCSVLTYGAILQSLFVPDRTGAPVDVVLGFDTLENYLTDRGYMGAVVGRFAGRIAAGRFTLDGREYTLAANNGPNHLHGGKVGYSPSVPPRWPSLPLQASPWSRRPPSPASSSTLSRLSGQGAVRNTASITPSAWKPKGSPMHPTIPTFPIPFCGPDGSMTTLPVSAFLPPNDMMKKMTAMEFHSGHF